MNATILQAIELIITQISNENVSFWTVLIVFLAAIFVILVFLRNFTTSEYVKTGHDVLQLYKEESEKQKQQIESLRFEVHGLKELIISYKNDILMVITTCEVENKKKCPVRNSLMGNKTTEG